MSGGKLQPSSAGTLMNCGWSAEDQTHAAQFAQQRVEVGGGFAVEHLKGRFRLLRIDQIVHAQSTAARPAIFARAVRTCATRARPCRAAPGPAPAAGQTRRVQCRRWQAMAFRQIAQLRHGQPAPAFVRLSTWPSIGGSTTVAAVRQIGHRQARSAVVVSPSRSKESGS